MFTRTIFDLTAIRLAGPTTVAGAEGPVPQAFRTFKPYHVVEQIMAQREVLGLDDAEFTSLYDLSIAIRTEKHRFSHKGGKPHLTRHVPMVSRQAAYDKALAVLTPQQQAALEALYPAPTQKAAPRPVRHRAPGKS